MACYGANLCYNPSCLVKNRCEPGGCEFCHKHGACREILEIIILAHDIYRACGNAVLGCNAAVIQDHLIPVSDAGKLRGGRSIECPYGELPCLKYDQLTFVVVRKLYILGFTKVLFNQKTGIRQV